MSRIVLILIVIAAVGILAFARLKAIYDRTGIEIAPAGVGFGSVLDYFKDPTKIAELIKGESVPSFRVDWDIMIWNQNNISITVRDLDIKLYADGQLIAKRSDITDGRITIAPNSFSKTRQSITVMLRKESVATIKELLVSGGPDISYEAKGKIYGVPFSWTDKVGKG